MKKLVNAACLTGPLIIVILLAGCATGPTQYAPLPEHLNAGPAPGKARICVIRGYVFFIGSGVKNHINEDGQPRGELINGSYICWERPPGVAEISLGNLDNIYYRGNLPVEADLVYYLYIDAVTPVKSISPEEGQKYLAEYPKPQVAKGATHPPVSYGQAPRGTAAAPPVGAQSGGPVLPPQKSVGY